MDSFKMQDNQPVEAFYDFLGEYAGFFKGMSEFEQQKLDILLGNRLPDIEHALSVTQANAMQLESLEQKRLRLQKAAGLADLSLTQLAAGADSSRQEQLGGLMKQLGGYLADIKYYNTKSMEVAQLKLRATEHTAPGAAAHAGSRLEAKA